MEKKNYVKPQIEMIELEPQQMICTSGDNEIQYNTYDNEEEWYGEFE